MIPDPDPTKALEGGLISFNGMVAKDEYDEEQDEVHRMLQPQDISTFMESLGMSVIVPHYACLLLCSLSILFRVILRTASCFCIGSNLDAKRHGRIR
jgi:hypothetical protein